jgi:transglutaminase-like putative cysteine protease
MDSSLQQLIRDRRWAELSEDERIGAVYEFVRNEIPFGYNRGDALPASSVLADGIGQCNTKTILLMALLRGTRVPCRFHGATIDERLQKGVLRGLAYRIAPQSIMHSWPRCSPAGGGWRTKG